MLMNTPIRLALTAGLLALVTVAGCRGDRSSQRPRQFLPDMDDSPSFKPQTATPFFADGRSMRRPVENTVAFGVMSDPADPARATHLKADTGVYFGKDASGKFLPAIPQGVNVDTKLLLRGQERYGIYCSACHGYDGKGKGTVGEQWSSPVANLMDAKYTDLATDLGKDGYIFHVIRNGLPADDPAQPMRMPAYGHSINEADAWAIVSYVRVLQAQQSGSIGDLSPAAREALEKSRAAEIERVKAEREKLAGAAAPSAIPAPAPGSAPAGQPEVKP